MFLPFVSAGSQFFERTLNRLLQAEPWALERLCMHSGKSVRLNIGPFSSTLVIQATGYVRSANDLTDYSVVLTLPSSQTSHALRLISQGHISQLSNLMHVQGDAGLANVVAALFAELRPDPEYALAQRIGDIPAHRLFTLGRTLVAGVRESAVRLSGNATEFVAYESNLLANQQVVADFASDLQTVQARLDALDQRIARLGAALMVSSSASRHPSSGVTHSVINPGAPA